MQIRKLDDLGRVVLPKELLAQAGIPAGGEVEVSLTDGAIAVRAHTGCCALCGGTGHLASMEGGKKLCHPCIEQVKSMV